MLDTRGTAAAVETVTLNIDGIDITVESGATVWDAASLQFSF